MAESKVTRLRPTAPAACELGDIFAEMAPFMVAVQTVDDSPMISPLTTVDTEHGFRRNRKAPPVGFRGLWRAFFPAQ